MLLGSLSALGAALLGAAFGLAAITLWLRLTSPEASVARTLMREAEGTVTFLFDDERLADATPRARDLIGERDKERSDWETLLQLLSGRFPHLRSQLGDLAEVGKKTIKPQDNQAGWIDAEYWSGLARITLVQDQDHPDETIDPLTATAIEHELETLRSIGEDSPQLIWKRDAEGVLVWANSSYIELTELLFPLDPDAIRPWPPQDIFTDAPRPAGTAPVIDMFRIELPDEGGTIWYEVTSLRRGLDTIHFAIDATAVVQARDAQRNFVQTLTKTFAQLSVGLAIFDVERRLVLFNPALVDLTHLQPDFLVGRPTLMSFLDRLRDGQMIPEPKDYTSWRDQISELESAAEAGSYHETWLLPTGQTFRVTGKPHPDGAIAFLIEDISDEISLTRKFRSQIDISTAVLDNLTSAVAVFSSSGNMIMANNAYRSLWGTDPEGSLANRDFSDELDVWEQASAPSPVWVKLQDTIGRRTSDVAWNGTIWLDSHVELTCYYAPLPDGTHQITFEAVHSDLDRINPVQPLDMKTSMNSTG